MRIWVDADACPAVVKEILFRAAERVGVELTLVANRALRIPNSRRIRCVQVPAGFDEADRWITGTVAAGDLVVTGDIPLAAHVIDKGAVALNPRGALYTRENIGDHLSTRNLMEQLRTSGLVSGGPPALTQSERQCFANQLDRLLANTQPR